MSTGRRPHVILIVCDELRADSLGYAGNEIVRTPHLDALAEDSMVFENAYCTSPMCCPSRASLATGRYPLSHGVLDNGTMMLSDEHSLYDSFRHAGYQTVNVGKWHANAGNDFGFDQNTQRIECADLQTSPWGIADRELRAQARYTKIPGAIALAIHGRRPFPAGETLDSQFTRAFIREVDAAESDGAPGFLRLSLFDPHSPYLPADPYSTMYDPEAMQLPMNFRASLAQKPVLQRLFHDARGFDRLSELDYKKTIACYYGLISHVDDRIGMLVDHLKTAGLYDRSIVVFCSDHGSMMGEHGYIEKWGHMYEPVARIPLMIKLPRGDGLHGVSGAFAENLDILPTIMDYLGIEVPERTQGRSFLPVVTGDAAEHRTHVHSMIFTGGFQTEPAMMIRDLRWKYTRYPDQESVERGLELDHPLRLSGYFDGDPVAGELYDLDADPLETANLFRDPAYEATRERYNTMLDDWVTGLGPIADYRGLNTGQNQSAFFRLAQSDTVSTVNTALRHGVCRGRFRQTFRNAGANE